MRWFGAAVCVAMIVPAILSAQPPRGPRPWWDRQLTRNLNLTDAQTKQIRATQEEFRGRMSDLQTAVNKAEGDFQAAINEEPVDQAKANDSINRLASARGDLTKAVSQMDLRLRMILTTQQWQELQDRQRSRPDRPGGRRRGPGPAPGSAPVTPTVKQQ
jgi:Spy/CpxP family protein refolding chaperone